MELKTGITAVKLLALATLFYLCYSFFFYNVFFKWNTIESISSQSKYSNGEILVIKFYRAWAAIVAAIIVLATYLLYKKYRKAVHK